MKKLFVILSLIAPLFCGAAEQYADLYVAPVGVYTLHNIHDTGEWGAGIEAGLNLNKYVGLGLVNISYAGQDVWQNSGLLVDETQLKVRANLLNSAHNRLQLQAVGTGNRDWNHEDWGFGIGLGVQLNLSKNFFARGDSQIRAWFNQPKDLQNTLSLGYSF